MISREGEPIGFLDVPRISEKTSNKMLQGWSKQYWPSDKRRYVARDMVNNGKELLLGSNVDWKLVLDSISIRLKYNNTLHFGEDALAINGAGFVGGLAAHAGWSMHDPQSVYLSGKYLAHIAGSKLEDFKTAMTLASVSYGQKKMTEAELLMKTLDLLLEHRDRKNKGVHLSRIGTLLRNGRIQDAYNVVSSRRDIVRRRG